MDADALFEEAEAALRANRIAEARALFGRAGEAGRHDAAVIHCNLTASSGDWAGGMRLLAELARTDRALPPAVRADPGDEPLRDACAARW